MASRTSQRVAQLIHSLEPTGNRTAFKNTCTLNKISTGCIVKIKR
ncbi:unnamed protein product [Schistosoma curassoni]|uniref:Transcriptional regulator n=1 Tax=Schistosoma curassoni TaxID=6186 RepID=A0A183JHE4_9TREM|nr:unnamed protein product [Schistosoma curassoni]